MTKAELLSKAKPILFNAKMVHAILDGLKTQTRRVVKPSYREDECGFNVVRQKSTGKVLYLEKYNAEEMSFDPPRYVEPPIAVGDYLYVRETWARAGKDFDTGFYEADTVIYKADYGVISDSITWHPSIHMPKEAARIFLRVTNVRVEKLQDIITGDYRTPININREGLLFPCSNCSHPNGECKDFIAADTCRLVKAYIDLWNSTVNSANIRNAGWQANPWVWVYDFEMVTVDE